MRISKRKVVKAAAIFLGLMLLFTLISAGANRLLTAEVRTASPARGDLSLALSAEGVAEGEMIVFRLPLYQDMYVSPGDTVSLSFSNIKGRLMAVVQGKEFDADTQTVIATCKLAVGSAGAFYDGQICSVGIVHFLGSYDMILPRECVIDEGSRSIVYVVETQDAVFGESEIVRAVEVSVLDTDELNAAVDAPLDGRSLVVRNSTKPLRHEMKVRSS